MAQPPESSDQLDRVPDDSLTTPEEGATPPDEPTASGDASPASSDADSGDAAEASAAPESDADAPAAEATESDADAPAAEASPEASAEASPEASAEAAQGDADAPAEASPEASAAAAQGDADAPAAETSPAQEAASAEASEETAEEAAPALPQDFDDFNLDPKLRSAITAMGWLRPTPVQSKAFGPLVRGGDLMVQSHTGSGKTGAFCLPWLAARFDPAPAKDTGVQLIVVLPTRELAKQVCVELGRLAAHLNIELLPVYGGTAMQPQLNALKAGVHAVVGTPGRILDHIRRRTLKLNRCRTVILDECDEMLSMGFLEDIRAILEACTADHQTCLFSATLPKDIQRIARRYMKTPEMITLSSDSVAAAEIDHTYYMISGMVRHRDLLNIITIEDPARAIVFCNTREETKLVANVLTREGYSAEALSSDLTQFAREKVMKAMKEHRIRFLVATDVAARGIDISQVTHVINYSFPENAESYVHRTGRTGRAGRKGTAISLIGPRDIGNFYYLKLQYPTIKPKEHHLPPPEQLQAARMELKLDEISRRFPEQVSPEWVALARGLMGDPRGEQVIALLLERAMKPKRRRRPPEDEEGREGYESHEGHEGHEEAPREAAESEAPRERDEDERPRRRSRERDGRRDGRRRDRGDRGRDRDRDRGGDRDRRRGRSRDRDRDGDRERGRGRRRRREEDDGGEPARAKEAQESPDTEAAAPATTPVTPVTTETPVTAEATESAVKAADATATEAETTEAETPEAETPDETQETQAEGEAPPRRVRRVRRQRRGRRRRSRDEDEVEAKGEGAEDNEADSEADASASSETDEDDSEAKASESETDAEGDEQPRRRRRRRRRRGRRRTEEKNETSEASASDEDEATAAAETEGEEDDESSSSSSGRRRRRRRRRGSGTKQAKPKEVPRVSQDEIIIDIDESELDVVRDHFGEVDELDDLTLKGRRRAVIDSLHDEVEIEDLSSDDAEDDEAEAEAEAATAEAEATADAPVEETEVTAEAAEGTDADDATEAKADEAPPKKRRRRRRRRKSQPIEMPELTAPPHKDFWEVWSARFTFQDFEDEKFLDKSEQEAVAAEEAAAEAAAAEEAAQPVDAKPAKARSRRAAKSSIPDEDFVKIRLNLGRSHGQKAATIRALLREHLSLEGRAIRDLTVRDASTLFRAPENDYDRISTTLDGVDVGGVTIAVSRPDSPKGDLRAPPPVIAEGEAEGQEQEAAENESAEATEPQAPADEAAQASEDAAPEAAAEAAEAAPAEAAEAAPAEAAEAAPAEAAEAAPAEAAEAAPAEVETDESADEPLAAEVGGELLAAADEAPATAAVDDSVSS